MNAPLFSVVVPVYNVEKYVKQCLESIAKQTFRDFELIIINDGSTDSSPKICEEFVNNNFSFARLINQENTGLALVRARGAKEAKGEYIVNIDSDDWVNDNYLEFMADIIAKHHPDIVATNYFINEDKLILNKNFDDVLFTKEDIKKKIYPYLLRGKDYSYFCPVAWAKAFKKEIFLNSVCSTRIQVGEDGAVTVPSVINSNSLYLASKALYHYRVFDNSMIQKKKPRSYIDVINIQEHLKNKIDLKEEDFALQLDRYIAHLAFNCSITQFYGRKYKDAKKIILEELEKPYLKEAIKNIDAAGFKGKLMANALKKKQILIMKIYSFVM